MKKLRLEDIQSLEEYERRRPVLRRQIIELKQARRVALGENLSIVFENRLTMLWQTQEMLRAERITDTRMVQEEIETYNQLIPDANQLRATLFIELQDSSTIEQLLPRFIGIENCLSLWFAGRTVTALAEEGRSTADKTATVHYLRFAFNPSDSAAFGPPVQLAADHHNYQARVDLGAETVASLREDLSSSD